jgi:hypothetical protein
MAIVTITTPDGTATAVNPTLIRCVKQKNEKVVLLVFDQSHYIEAMGTVAGVAQQLGSDFAR